MINFLNLYKSHLQSSKRIILISSIGLILALTIVSSTNYYFDNSKQALVENYFNINSSYRSSDIRISFDKPLPYNENALVSAKQTILQTAKQYNINFFENISSIDYLSNMYIFMNVTSIKYNYSDSGFSQVPVMQLNNSLLSELNSINSEYSIINNSQVPTETFANGIPDVYFLSLNPRYEKYDFNLSSNKETFLYDCPYCGYSPHNYTIRIAGAASVNFDNYIYYQNEAPVRNDQFNKYPLLQSLLRQNFGYQYVIFTRNLTSFTSILNPKYSQLARINQGQVPTIHYSYGIYFDYSKIDPYNTGLLVETVNNYLISLQTNIYSDLGDISYLSISFPAQYQFQYLQSTLEALLALMLIVSLPVLLITIFVINYSFGLINKNIIRQIGIYKTRGAQSRMIFVFQLLDMVAIIILSILVALITGIPIAALVIKTDFLLSFNYPSPSYLILNFIPVSNLLLYFAFALLLLVNTLRVKRLSQISIVDTELPVEKGEPFWKRHYIDVLLLAFGMLMYGTFLGITRNQGIARALGPILNIITILMVPAPFALVIGLVLIVNRIIPIILNRIGTSLWIRTGGLIAFSFKNVIRHRQASTRAVMLIAILLAFMVFFYSLPYSAILNSERTLYYQYGAEAIGGFDGEYNQTSLNIIQNNFSQYLDGFSPYVILTTQSSDSFSNNYEIMLINTSTYLKSAYLNFDLGITKNLNNDIENLNVVNESKNITLNVLFDQQNLKDRKGAIGDTIKLFDQNNPINLHVYDTFRNWPVLKSYAFYSNDYFAIGNIDYYLSTINRNISQSPFTSAIAQGVLLNFKDGVNQTLISSWISGNTSININSIVSETLHQQFSSIQFRIEIGQLNNDVLMVIIISMTVLIMFAYLQLTERKTEIYTERAIGMKLPQIALLFFIETIILSLTSILIGLGVGGFLTELIAILIFNPLGQYPPFEILFPMDYILITSTIVLITSFLVSIVPAYYVTKQDISKSFGEI